MIPLGTRLVAGLLMVVGLIGVLTTGTAHDFHEDNAVGQSANVLISMRTLLGWYVALGLGTVMYFAALLEQLLVNLVAVRMHFDKQAADEKRRALVSDAKARGDTDLERFVSKR